MKKIVSLLLATIMLVSSVILLSSCNSDSKKFDELSDFISEKGNEADGKISITKNLSELGDAWDDSTTKVTISYEKNTGNIIIEETTENSNYTTYCKLICDKNSDDVDVIVKNTYSDDEDYYKGYISKISFSDTNRKIYGFEADSMPLGEENAKALLGTYVHLLLSYTKYLLWDVNSPVSLNDIGFTSNYK